MTKTCPSYFPEGTRADIAFVGEAPGAEELIEATGVDVDASPSLFEAAAAAEGREFKAKIKITKDGWTNLSGFATV